MFNIKFPIETTHPNLENLRNVYFSIKERTINILSQFYDDNTIEDPSVDINLIADNIGIKHIVHVSPEFIQDAHSYLTKNNIILLNEEDSQEEQFFSIAHEIAHFISRENDITDIARGETSLKTNKINNLLDISNFCRIIKAYSNEVAERVTIEIGKPVTEKKASQLFTRIANNTLLTVERNFIEKSKNFNFSFKNFKDISHILINEMSNHYFNILKRVFDEEIADYFAANLLVPTEQFILWQNKTNEEIAKAFKVDERCIEKRRHEILHEIDFITPKNLASDIILENQIPLSSDELYHLAGGLTIHDGT